MNMETAPLPPIIPAASGSQGTRLGSLDIFRGLIIAGMILVTDPGTYTAVYSPLLHAQWSGATATDMIFPSFLVVIGVSLTLSFRARLDRGSTQSRLLLHVLRRTVVLFALGLLVNGFPFFHLQTLRIPGVLQRIALCYLAASVLYLALSPSAEKPAQSHRRVQIVFVIILALLLFYWAMLRLYPVPGFGPGRLDSLGNVGAYFDRQIFGIAHLWPWGLTPGRGVTFDPEGLLSTLPALATLLFGVLAGEWLRRDRTPAQKAFVLAITGAILTLAGLALSPSMPLIKKIWTPTFAVFSAGIALLLFSFFYFVLDVRHFPAGTTSHTTFWTTPLRILGVNAIFAFVLSGSLTTLSDTIHLSTLSGPLTLHQAGYQYLFATWLRPIHASLAYALTVVLFNIVLLTPLFRKQIFLRI